MKRLLYHITLSLGMIVALAIAMLYFNGFSKITIRSVEDQSASVKQYQLYAPLLTTVSSQNSAPENDKMSM